MPKRAGFVLLCLLAGACGGDDALPIAPDAAPRPTVFGGDRPATLHVPDNFDPAKKYPLIMILHGYSATGFLQEAYFGLRAEVDAGNALEIAPDGLKDSTGNQYWNADPACCDFDHTNPDDSGYLGKMLTDIIAAYPVDPAQVFVIGHSNGGYMAYRMACDHADVVTTIGVLAGIVSTDPSVCVPSHPVNVLHMHGTADTEVPYAMTSTYPGAVGSVQRWAGYDGCGSDLTDGATLDLDTGIPGAETQISDVSCTSPQAIDPTALPFGSAAGAGQAPAIELWTLNGSSHVPPMSAAFEPALYGWLTAHGRDN
jgi:polyhydroxybutyrate depolymerase